MNFHRNIPEHAYFACFYNINWIIAPKKMFFLRVPTVDELCIRAMLFFFCNDYRTISVLSTKVNLPLLSLHRGISGLRLFHIVYYSNPALKLYIPGDSVSTACGIVTCSRTTWNLWLNQSNVVCLVCLLFGAFNVHLFCIIIKQERL